MTIEVKNYDPASITLNLGSVQVKGFEPGTFVSLVRNVNSFDWSVGPDGIEGIRTKRNDRSALLTLTLRQTSSSNLTLSNLANRDEAGSDGVVEVSITDTDNPDTVFTSGKGWVEKPADAAYAETPQGRAWQIRLAEVPMVHGGSPELDALTEAI